MKKKILIGLMACSLSTHAFAWGRDSDVDYLVDSYQKELASLKKAESKKEAEKQKAISQAQASINAYQKTISSYDTTVKKYETQFLAPTRKSIEAKKKQAEGYRNKIKEYKTGLDKAVKEQRFSKRGMFGAIGGSKYGAADYQDLISSAESSLKESERIQADYEASLKKYEGQKKEYEGSKAAKLKEMETAKANFDTAEGNLKAFREESSEHLASSTVPTLNAVVGQMVQRGKNGSLEAEMLLRDLDNLATKMGLSKEELQRVFASNPELRGKLANTAIGGYVNTQIANAMGSVCEYQNMCAAKNAKDMNALSPEIVKKSMEHLHDQNRGAAVTKSLGEQPSREPTSDEVEAIGK